MEGSEWEERLCVTKNNAKQPETMFLRKKSEADAKTTIISEFHMFSYPIHVRSCIVESSTDWVKGEVVQKDGIDGSGGRNVHQSLITGTGEEPTPHQSFAETS